MKKDLPSTQRLATIQKKDKQRLVLLLNVMAARLSAHQLSKKSAAPKLH